MPDTKLYDPSRDFRHVTFNLNLNNQDFELALLSVEASEKMFFYTIFKPTEYEHIIHLSPPSMSWTESIASFNQIFKEVCRYFNVQESGFPEILSFISSHR